MPQLIQHIDHIALEKQRDLLFLSFADTLTDPGVYYQDCTARKDAIEWLEANNIPYQPCGLPSNEEIHEYLGHLYIDVPMEETNSLYQKLLAHFEDEQGLPKNPECTLYLYALQDALTITRNGESQADK